MTTDDHLGDRIRCAYVYPSRRRCSNTATVGGYCDTHWEHAVPKPKGDA